MTDVIVTVLVFLIVVFAVAALLVYRTRGWAPSWSVRAETELELPVGRADAFARAKVAVSGLRLLSAPRIDEASGTIEAKVFGLWRTFGDLVTLGVDEIDATNTRVRIRSRPILPQGIDYGASRDRVDGLRRTLEGVVS
jgi:hypothetical protein